MIDIKQKLSIVFFILFCLGVMSLSFFKDWSKNSFLNAGGSTYRHSSLNDSYFKFPVIYILKDFKSFLLLRSEELVQQQDDGKVLLTSPHGTLWTTEERIPLDYTAESGYYIEERQHLYLNRNVELHKQESDDYLLSESLNYSILKDKAIAREDVRSQTISVESKDIIKINSDMAEFYPAQQISIYRGNVNGSIKGQRVYEEGIRFNSNYAKSTIAKGVAELEGDVVIRKQGVTAFSRRGEIFLDNRNKKLKYFVLYDDVKVIEKVNAGEKPFERRAYGEKLEGIASEEKLILTGYPKVYQLNDLIKGNRIIIRENTEVIEVDDSNSNFLLK